MSDFRPPEYSLIFTGGGGDERLSYQFCLGRVDWAAVMRDMNAVDRAIFREFCRLVVKAADDA